MTDLQVVWPKRWVADEFEAAGVSTRWHMGLMTTVAQTGPIWWATEHAARSIAAGNRVFLTAPNAEDLVALPYEFLKRDVRIVTMGELADWKSVRFVKSADSKIDGPGAIGLAMVCEPWQWVAGCREIGVPDDLTCLVSDVVEWEKEWRVWYDGTDVLEISLYRVGDAAWDEWPAEPVAEDVAEFARQAAHCIRQPCVIDIGVMEDGFAVVETNPVWSSGPYTSDFAQIFKAIKASYVWAVGGHGRKWVPDEWLTCQMETRWSHDVDS